MAQLSSGYRFVLMPAELTTGQLALAMVVKRTYRIEPTRQTLEPLPDADQPAPLPADRHDDGDPTTGPVTLETDLVPEKARVDVLVLGKAYAPGGKQVPQFDCTLQIGRVRRALRILGRRRVIWQPPRKQDGKMQPQPPRFTEPEPVQEVPLSLTLAYGGWSWLVPDDETLRIQRAVAKVMAEEAAADAGASPSAGTANQAAKGPAAVSGEAEKLRFGDGSEGYDADGVRLWNAAASNDGTAVRSVDEFARQELADQARKLRSPLASGSGERKQRQNAAGEWLEVDDGVELLTDAALAGMRAEMPGKTPATRPDADVVLNPDGARALTDAQSGTEWDADLRDGIAAEDTKTATERRKVAEDRRKAEDAALAEFPRMPCPTNPFGVGFCLSNHPQVLVRTVLPQIEDPLTQLTPGDLVRDFLHLDAVPVPAGFGVLPRQARPRIDLAGPLPSDLGDWQENLDAQKQQVDLGTREGVQALRAMEARQEPLPMRSGYYNCALPALQFAELRGDEDVLLENLTPSGRLAFKLPARSPIAELDRGRGVERRNLRLDTVVIDADKAEVSLVWRAQFALASWDELATYSHVIGHVLDWSLADRRKQDDDDAARKRRGEGTGILDLNALPPAISATPDAVRQEKTDALELPKMGTYLEAADDGWAERADEAAAGSAERREKQQAERAWRERKTAALKQLADDEQAEQTRRAEIAAAVAAGKPVPAKRPL